MIGGGRREKGGGRREEGGGRREEGGGRREEGGGRRWREVEGGGGRWREVEGGGGRWRGEEGGGESIKISRKYGRKGDIFLILILFNYKMWERRVNTCNTNAKIITMHLLSTERALLVTCFHPSPWVPIMFVINEREGEEMGLLERE